MNGNYIVAGGTGLIGSAFLRHMRGLWGLGAQVCVPTRGSLMGAKQGNVTYYRGDLTRQFSRGNLRTDALVYAVGQNRGPGYHATTDLLCAQNMCEYAIQSGIQRCVLISTGAVSMAPAAGEPIWATKYRDTKAHIEEMFINTFPQLVILRVYSLIGPDLPQSFAIRQFIDACRSGGPLEVYKPNYRTAYLSTIDLAHWMAISLKELTEGVYGKYVYDCAGDIPYRLGDVAKFVQSVFGGPAIQELGENIEPTVYHPASGATRFPMGVNISLHTSLRMLKHYGVETQE